MLEGERVREKGAGEEWGMLGGLGGREGGRIDMGSGKNISQLRESFKVYRRLDYKWDPRSKERSPDCSLDRGEGT